MKKVPVSNIYYLLCYAWGHADWGKPADVEELDRLDRVIDLFGKVLAEGTMLLVRRGLDRGYQEFQEELKGIRGKLAVSTMAKRALQARGRTACIFEDLSYDVLHNRILKSTLHYLLREERLQDDVRDRVQLAFSKLPGIKVVPLSRGIFRQVQMDRNRRAYLFLLSLCALIHERRLVSEDPGAARFRDLQEDQLVMWSLFEDFVREFYVREQSIFRVNPRGRTIAWFDAQGDTPEDLDRIPTMYADVILESRDRRVVLDAKFYRERKQKVNSANLYQILAYVRNREATEPQGPQHEGILLYPVVGDPVSTSLRLEGFRIRAYAIDFTQRWNLIHHDMLGVLDLTSDTNVSRK